MIKAIIFDCFGVLTVDTWRALYASCDDELRSQVDKITKAYDSGYINRKTLVQQASDILGIDETVVREAQVPKNVKNLELIELIKQLKSQNYKIGLLSNINNNWIREHFLSVEEQNLFDVMLMSYEVGMAKPDPQIYKIVSERLNVKEEHCVFIDDIEIYCQAAQGVGMKAIHYENIGQTKAQLEDIQKP